MLLVTEQFREMVSSRFVLGDNFPGLFLFF